MCGGRQDAPGAVPVLLPVPLPVPARSVCRAPGAVDWSYLESRASKTATRSGLIQVGPSTPIFLPTILPFLSTM